jgi:hypothetical protein
MIKLRVEKEKCEPARHRLGVSILLHLHLLFKFFEEQKETKKEEEKSEGKNYPVIRFRAREETRC